MFAPVLLGLAVLGQDVEEARIVYADDYKAAFEEAGIRNVPVLIIDFDGWSTARGHQIDHILDDKKFQGFADRFVLLASSQHKHERKKQLVDGEEREVCEIFGGVPCEVTRRIKGDVFGDFAVDGTLISPCFIFADPKKKELTRLEHEQEPGELIREMKLASARIGKGLARSEYVRARQGVARLDRFLTLQEWAPAVELAQELEPLAGGKFTVHEQLRAAIASLDTRGEAMIEEATEIWARGSHLDALKRLDKVQASFLSRSPAKTAGALVAKWQKTEEGKVVLADFKIHQKARKLYDQGMKLDREGEFKKAVSVLKNLRRRYPQTLFAEQAESTIRVLEESLKKKRGR